MINAIAPVWDGNEVWLLTAGGALFAAFPKVYATVFSSFYLAFVLLLLALIFRAVSMEFRGKVDSPAWRRLWDWAFGLGSMLPAILFGVAMGNILRGLPLNSRGVFTGSFFGLLNPFSVYCGFVSLVLFTLHGAIYLNLKTDGELQARIKKAIPVLWIVFIVMYICATILAIVWYPYLFSRLSGNPLFWILLSTLLISILAIPVSMKRQNKKAAFSASAILISSVIGLIGISLYPRLVPSITDLNNSLTIYNASSTPRTLTVMLFIALIGMPLVLGYTLFIYRVFKGKVVLSEDSY